MSYPLKAIRLPSALSALLRHLEASGESSLEDIYERVSGIGKPAREDFLYQLEKAGWVRSSGLKIMSPTPKVTIIVPVRNRADEIRSCLTSLLGLDYPDEKREIIVVDDASNDETPQVVESFPVTLQRMRRRQGASACRNWGARHANGEILCFLDSDCSAEPDWLKELLPVFRSPAVGAAGGLVDSDDDRTALDRYEKVKSSLYMGKHPTDSSMGNRFFYLPSCNLAVRTVTFLEVGGFDDCLEIGEDVDLCWRVIDMGSIVEYRPSARVSHKHRNSLWSFCRRRFEYGTSEPLLQELHPDRIKTFVLWPKSLIFWGLFATAVLAASWGIGVMAAAWLLFDAIVRRHGVARLGVTLRFGLVLTAIVRSNASFLYHCSSFVSRYYLVCAIVLAPIFPELGTVVLALHLGVGAVEFLVRKPRLNVISFVGLFSLEQLSYQAGVWFGCLRDKFFRPLVPRISLRSVMESRDCGRQ